MEKKSLKYTAIGIRCDYATSTRVGASVYKVFFSESDGEIRGPFRVRGGHLDGWHIRRGQNFGHVWRIDTHMTPSGKEIIDHITKEG